MAYLHFGNNIRNFGNYFMNSGESFVLKAVGDQFPSLPNGSVTFKFSTPERVTVNYGDGTVLSYTATFETTGIYTLQLYATFATKHIYADGQILNRNISFSFDRSKLIYLNLTNQRLQVADFLFEFSKYPALKSFLLVNETSILNLNVESIVGSNITDFLIASAFVPASRLYRKIPIEIFTTPLVSLGVGTSGFHEVSFADSNLDKMYLIKNTLTSLVIVGYFTDNNFGDGALPANYNQLINLKSIQLSNTMYTTTPPVVNQIPTLTTLYIGFSTTYVSYGDFSSLVNLTTLNFNSNLNITDSFPAYFSTFTKLKTLDYRACFLTQARVNNFVDSMYSLTVNNAPITGISSNPFRSMTINIGTFGSSVPPSPSGTYQQPSGYIQGSNNGSPASQKEKIWVMANQYGHTWATN